MDGSGPGERSYPGYGKYIPKHYIKAFFHVLPLLWAPEEYWFRDQRTLPWEVVKPFFQELNRIRKEMMRVTFLVLNESMFGFRPKIPLQMQQPGLIFRPT